MNKKKEAHKSKEVHKPDDEELLLKIGMVLKKSKSTPAKILAENQMRLFQLIFELKHEIKELKEKNHESKL